MFWSKEAREERNRRAQEQATKERASIYLPRRQKAVKVILACLAEHIRVLPIGEDRADLRLEIRARGIHFPSEIEDLTVEKLIRLQGNKPVPKDSMLYRVLTDYNSCTPREWARAPYALDLADSARRMNTRTMSEEMDESHFATKLVACLFVQHPIDNNQVWFSPNVSAIQQYLSDINFGREAHGT